MSKFPCTSCGACCKSVKGLIPIKDGTTECVYLKDNKCSIYNTRPLLCKIDEGFEKLKKFYKDKNEYYLENMKKCNELMDLHDVDLNYRIIIEEN